MATAAYSIQIDFDKDSTYGHAQSNITDYVLDAQWNNGMSQAGQHFANPAQLTLTLDNTGGDFNLEDSGATFYGLFKKGLLVRVQATFSASTKTLFIGKLYNLPSMVITKYGERPTVSLAARDLMYELLDAEFIPELLTSTTTEAVIQHVFDKAVVALPYASDYWILGETSSQLGTNTRLVDTNSYVSLETGKTTFAYVGDNTGGDRSVRAQTYLRDAVDGEAGGRFWFDTRTGLFTFHNRHHDINYAVDLTVTSDDYDGGQYQPQTEVYNRVTVHYSPRKVGSAGSILWSLDNALQLGPGETKTVTARYRDATNEAARVGATAIIAPVASTDYTANDAEDGTGTDRTTSIFVSCEQGAQQSRISVTNGYRRGVFVTFLQLRGTPLSSFQRQSATASDGTSYYNHDIRDDQITLVAIDDVDFATDVARRRVKQYKDARSVFNSIYLIANNTDTRMTQALTYTIGDVVTVRDSAISHDTDYVIIGEQHRVTAGGDHTHETTWILSTLDMQQYWVLEDAVLGKLGTTTYLAL